MNVRLERFGPFLLAMIAPVVYFVFWWHTAFAPSSTNLDSTVQGVLSLSGILVGFLATAKALLFALPDRPTIQFLKKAGAFDGLSSYLFTDIRVWLVTATSSLIIFLISANLSLEERQIMIGIWLYLPMAGILSFWRSMGIFAKVLRLSAAGDEASKKKSV